MGRCAPTGAISPQKGDWGGGSDGVGGGGQSWHIPYVYTVCTAVSIEGVCVYIYAYKAVPVGGVCVILLLMCVYTHTCRHGSMGTPYAIPYRMETQSVAFLIEKNDNVCRNFEHNL